MDTVVIDPDILYYGTSITLITTRNPDGSANITPLSSSWSLGKHLVLGMGKDGQGYLNLMRTREGVINVPAPNLLDRVVRLGTTTGRDPVPTAKRQQGYTFEPDKFALATLSPLPSELVDPPRIAECPLQLEARLLGAHDNSATGGDASAWFAIVELAVVRVHAHVQVVVPGTNHIDPDVWQPLLYVFRHFATTTGLGKAPWAEH